MSEDTGAVQIASTCYCEIGTRCICDTPYKPVKPAIRGLTVASGYSVPFKILNSQIDADYDEVDFLKRAVKRFDIDLAALASALKVVNRQSILGSGLLDRKGEFTLRRKEARQDLARVEKRIKALQAASLAFYEGPLA
mgnify:FL=1|jgi:hypothetical protein